MTQLEKRKEKVKAQESPLRHAIAGALFSAFAIAGCGGYNSMSPTHPAPNRAKSHFLYVVNSIQNTVSGFVIDAVTGALTSTGPAMPADESPIYAAASPNGKFLYVANAGTNSKGVSGYTIDQVSGALTPTSPAAFPTTGDTEPFGIVVDPSSTHVYTANAGGISAFSINPQTGALSDVPGTPVLSPPESLFENLAVSPDGRFLYVTDGPGRQVFSFTIDGNGLPHPMNATAPSGKFPEGIVVDPSSRFVYVANWNSDNVSAYTITPGTGVLVPAPQAAPTELHCGPQELAIDPASKFLYVSCGGLSNIDPFAIDPATGALSALRPFSTGQFTQPRGIAVDASGLFLYSALNMQNRAGTAAISANGSLTVLSAAPSTGRGPLGVALAGQQ
jgi:6-phosphogluconolactonase (cycloisomerase 2 family)